MGIFSGPQGGTVYFDPNNEYAVNYVSNGNAPRETKLFGNAVLTGKLPNNEEASRLYGLSRDPNVLKSTSSKATPSVSGGTPNQPEATALDAFKIKDKEDDSISRKKASNQKGNKSLTIPVGNSGGVSMVGKV